MLSREPSGLASSTTTTSISTSWMSARLSSRRRVYLNNRQHDVITTRVELVFDVKFPNVAQVPARDGGLSTSKISSKSRTLSAACVDSEISVRGVDSIRILSATGEVSCSDARTTTRLLVVDVFGVVGSNFVGWVSGAVFFVCVGVQLDCGVYGASKLWCSVEDWGFNVGVKNCVLEKSWGGALEFPMNDHDVFPMKSNEIFIFAVSCTLTKQMEIKDIKSKMMVVSSGCLQQITLKRLRRVLIIEILAILCVSYCVSKWVHTVFSEP